MRWAPERQAKLAKRQAKNGVTQTIGAGISGWVSSLDRAGRARILRIASIVAGVAILLAVVHAGLARVESRVHALPRYDRPLSLEWMNLPDWMRLDCNRHIVERLTARAGLNLNDRLLDNTLAERIGRNLSDPAIGWIRQVDRVVVGPDGRIALFCQFRRPTAWVRSGNRCYLVDSEGVLLPDSYAPAATRESGLFTLAGVEKNKPDHPGVVWPGDDVQAGLKTITLVEGRSFSRQITAIDVSNFGGRKAPHHAHIELVTDRAGSRIRWGRAPGSEDGMEIAASQKIALLEALYRNSGRVDLNQTYVDVTTGANMARVPRNEATSRNALLRG